MPLKNINGVLVALTLTIFLQKTGEDKGGDATIYRLLQAFMDIKETKAKEKLLREIILWASEAKQKSLNLQKQYILEFSEEIEMDSLSECDGIVYSLFDLSSILCDIIEGCKTVEGYISKK